MSFIRRQYRDRPALHLRLVALLVRGRDVPNLIWLGNLGVLVLGLSTGSPSPWIPLAVSAVLYLVTVYRGWLRQGLVKIYFPEWEKASRRIQRFDIWANPLVELAHWIGVGQRGGRPPIIWRGIRYHVLPGGQVQEIIHGESDDVKIDENSDSERKYYRMAG